MIRADSERTFKSALNSVLGKYDTTVGINL